MTEYKEAMLADKALVDIKISKLKEEIRTGAHEAHGVSIELVKHRLAALESEFEALQYSVDLLQ